MKKGPSKKVIFYLVAALTFLGVIVYALFFSAKTETYVAPVVSLETGESPLLAKDSDNDGLKDWEEELWKTDKFNPDTDGDGAPDGAEIKLGRNPLIAGPNDKMDTDTIASKINTETDKDLSETDKFSRELFIKIIAAKNNNTPPTEDDIKKFLQSNISQELKNQPVKTFGTGDFTVDQAETPESVTAYGNEIGRIMTKKPVKPLEYEMAIVDRATQNKKSGELNKLDDNIAEFRRIENDLLKVTVPASAAEKHAAFTGSIEGMIYSITGFKYIFSDPVKALPGVSLYGDNSAAFVQTLQALKRYFNDKGVVFEAESNGYRLFNGI